MTSASIYPNRIGSHLRRRRTSRLRPLTLAYALIFPSLVLLIIFTYVPIVEALLQAFRIERFGGKFEGLRCREFRAFICRPGVPSGLP
jgi:ABC-type sugar transport system permease subunit